MQRKSGSALVFLKATKSLPEPNWSVVNATEISAEEVAKHCTAKDGWVSCDGYVYDITQYCQYHPGGKCVESWLGKDITKINSQVHAWIDVRSTLSKLCIGRLQQQSENANPFAK